MPPFTTAPRVCLAVAVSCLLGACRFRFEDVPAADAGGGTSEDGASGDDASGDDDASPDGGASVSGDGGGSASDGGTPPTTEHLIFASSATLPGTFTLANADQLCAQAAQAGALPGTYKALVSTSTSSALGRLALNRAVVNRQLAVVAPNPASFWSATHLAAVAFDENGVPNTNEVWTGTARDGSADNNTCADWTSGTSRGLSGSPTAMNSSWAELAPRDCAVARSFYCVSD